MAIRKSVKEALEAAFGGGATIEAEDTYEEIVIAIVSHCGRRKASINLHNDPTCCGAAMATGPNTNYGASANARATLFLAAEEVAAGRVRVDRHDGLEDGDDEEPYGRGFLSYTTPEGSLWAKAAAAAGWRRVTTFYNPNSTNNVAVFSKVINRPQRN